MTSDGAGLKVGRMIMLKTTVGAQSGASAAMPLVGTALAFATMVAIGIAFGPTVMSAMGM